VFVKLLLWASQRSMRGLIFSSQHWHSSEELDTEPTVTLTEARFTMCKWMTFEMRSERGRSSQGVQDWKWGRQGSGRENRSCKAEEFMESKCG
jgi:hypothetical protein